MSIFLDYKFKLLDSLRSLLLKLCYFSSVLSVLDEQTEDQGIWDTC